MKATQPLTIALVCSKEPDVQIQRCFEALKKQSPQLEALFDRILWVIVATPSSHERDWSFFDGHLIYSNTENLAENRNRALEFSPTGWLYFTDPDCWDPQDSLYKLCCRALSCADKSIVGFAGPNKMYTQSKNLNLFFQFLNGARWITGRLPQVYTPERASAVAHAPTCNILYNLELVGTQRFDPKFKFVGEDIEFHHRLKSMGFMILFCPESWVWHEQHPHCFSFLKKTFRYGFAQTQLLKTHPKTLTNRRLIALWGIAALFAAAALMEFKNLLVWGAVLIFMSLLVLVLELKWARFSLRSAIYLWPFPASFIVYGLGQIFGLLVPLPKN